MMMSIKILSLWDGTTSSLHPLYVQIKLGDFYFKNTIKESKNDIFTFEKKKSFSVHLQNGLFYNYIYITTELRGVKLSAIQSYITVQNEN
jgi:hypothetical protein